MKRYKLLKDLPTFKAGDKFYLDINNNLRLSESEIIAYSHITLEKFPNILKDWFEEIPEYKRWRAECNNLYYFINSYGEVLNSFDHREDMDNYRYKTGSYGRTKEELEAKLKYDIAYQILLDDAKGGKWKKDGANSYVYYDHDIDEWIPYKDIDNIQIMGAIYFQDEENAQQSIKEHKEQWEIVHKYEMGEM